MADKDYKDMTISVLLRHVGYKITEGCDLYRSTDVIDTLRDVLYVEEHPTHYSIDMVNILDSIANKIDVELAEARANGISEGVEASLFVAAKAWAKDNGWPDFHDGEDFGAWLERCTYKKLVDDRNEPVQFGDEIELHHRDGDVDKGRFQEVVVNKGPVWMLSFTGVDHEHLHRYDSEYDVLKRSAPEVLGADGKPIVVGETVYSAKRGEAFAISAVDPVSSINILVCNDNDSFWSAGKYFTHTPPDTQERIDEDAKKDPCDYFDRARCDEDCRAYHEDSCETVMVLDLLRRQRELDKRTGGDA